jgi:integrase
VGAHLGDLDAVRLDRLDKRTAASALRLPGASASVRRATYAALVKVLDYAVDAGLVGVHVARQVPRPLAPEPRNREVSAADAQAILDKARGHRYEVAAWLAFGCGLRRGEVLALRWSEVDLKGGTLTVSGNVTRSSAGLQRGATKTRRGRRNVPVPPVVVQALKAHKKRQSREQLAAGSSWESTGLVVATELGGMVEPRTLSRVWQRWARDAGVADTGTHTGRHYAASTLLASGAASVADVAAQLGHDPAVLLNTYAVAVAEGQRAAADVLGSSLRMGTTRGTTRTVKRATD